MILQISYIISWLFLGLTLLGVGLGPTVTIVAGISALIIAASYIFTWNAPEGAPRRNWLW